MTIVERGGTVVPRPAPQLDVELILRCGSAVVAVSGELDAGAAPQYESLVAALVRVPGVGRVEIDGRGLDFVDSAGVHALLRSRADASAAGVAWFLGPASPALRRVLDLVGVGFLHDVSMN